MEYRINNLITGLVVVFLISSALLAEAQESAPPYALVGPHRTLLYVDNDHSDGSGLPARHIIYKSDGEGRKFRRIGRTGFPENARQLERQLERLGISDDVYGHFGVNTMEAIYGILQTHGTDTLGLLLLDPDLAAAVGRLFIDEYKTKSEQASYRIDRLDADDRVVSAVTVKPDHQRESWTSGELTVDTYQSLDSSVSIAWRAEAVHNPLNIPLVATIYKRLGHTGGFTPQQKLLMLSDAESGEARAYFSDTVEPGQHLAYYAELEDLAGNTGRLSDTVSILPYNLSSLQHISNFAVTDTSGGLLLTWNPLPADAIYSAIEIRKSRQLGSGYVPVDTVPANHNAYLDRQVIPSTAYYYQVKPLIYQLSANTPALNYAEAMGYRSGANSAPPLAPTRLHVTTDPAGVKVKWSHGNELNLFGYYVLRGPTEQSMSVISPAIQDTVFVDSLIPRHFTGQMHYAVQSMDMAQQLSDTSGAASIFIRQPVLLASPTGVHASRTMDGVTLEWDNAALRDVQIHGYQLYRKRPEDTYYERVNGDMLTTVYYTDHSAVGTDTYEYAVSSTDVWGNESILSPTVRVDADELTTVVTRPPDVMLRNLSAGIEVSWPIPVHGQQSMSYVIYRKELSASSFDVIATVRPTEKFVDPNVEPGVRYQYAVAIASEGEVGQPELPKTVKRR